MSAVAPVLVLAAAAASAKKLIEFGWDIPSPTYVSRHIRQMEARPFDGVVIRSEAGSKVFLHDTYSPIQVDIDRRRLRDARFETFTDNFLLIWATADAGWDWFDESDWRSAEHNLRGLARIAGAGRLRGVLFDPEPYGPNPWAYAKQPRASERSFADYQVIIRQRGERFMRILSARLPDVRVLSLFHVGLFANLLELPDRAAVDERLAAHAYGLLPSFLQGWLDAAGRGAQIIDGNEFAYYYRGPAAYFQAFHTTRQRGATLFDAGSAEEYARRVRLGQAVYIDLVYGLSPVPQAQLARALTPEERAAWLEHNVYYALYTADEYVWCYGEQLDWWKGQLPQGAEEAIRRARSKIAHGEPLGFTLEEMLKAAESR